MAFIPPTDSWNAKSAAAATATAAVECVAWGRAKEKLYSLSGTEFSYALVVVFTAATAVCVVVDGGGGDGLAVVAVMVSPERQKFFVQKLVLFKRIIFCSMWTIQLSHNVRDIHSKTGTAAVERWTRAFKNLSFISFKSEIDNNNFPCLWTQAFLRQADTRRYGLPRIHAHTAAICMAINLRWSKVWDTEKREKKHKSEKNIYKIKSSSNIIAVVANIKRKEKNGKREWEKRKKMMRARLQSKQGNFPPSHKFILHQQKRTH